MEQQRTVSTARRRGRLALRSATAATLAVATLAIASGTAHADKWARHDQDWAQATSSAVRAFDGEADGNGVYADVYLTVTGRHMSVWDGNGADGNPGPWLNVGGTIAKFRVCEDHDTCSDWIYDPA